MALSTADLVERIKALSQPMSPRPTDAAPKLTRFSDIRAVLFDVYGTMVISGSGDVGTAAATDSATALREAFAEVGFSIAQPIAEQGVATLKQTIQAHHADARSRGVAWPEIDIREIWAKVIAALVEQGDLDRDAASIDTAHLAVAYECRVNPTWPMPALDETLASLRDAGLLLGIVSNSQFCTPLLFEAYLDRSTDALGFGAERCVWSYVLREGKPSSALYEQALRSLQPMGIAASQVLYVGNDIRNDIGPAQAVGMKGVLFAGDERSLRWREDDPSCKGVEPAAVITSLDQLPGLTETG